MSTNTASEKCKEKITIMLVIGQSNAEGAGYIEEKGIVDASNGKWELSAMPTTAEYGQVFMSLSEEGLLVLGKENEYSTNFVDVKGGFAPAFAAKWNELTGEKVAVLQLAVGATNLAEWQKMQTKKDYIKNLNLQRVMVLTAIEDIVKKKAIFFIRGLLMLSIPPMKR